MKILNEERKAFANGENKGVVIFTLYSDEIPASLNITGEDLGRDDNIAVGSFLLTPSKRFIYGEQGRFVELGW